MIEIQSFSRVRSAYRCVLFDAYGVLRDASGLLDGTGSLLRELTAAAIPFWIVTNDASQPPDRMAAKYADADGPLVRPDQIACAGHLATRYLKAHFPGRPVACLGPEPSRHYLRAAGNPIVPREAWEPGAAAAFLLMDDSGFPWEEDLNHALNFLRDSPDTALITPNPDHTFRQAAGRFGIGVGAITALLEVAVGRPFKRLGKPAPALFELALEQARAALPGLVPSEALMVGDTLTTDIVGARTLGIRTALVLSGNTAPDRFEDEIKETGIVPDHVVTSICS
jgi:HAD superfamily hydrolase (TIGR01450 family)